MIYDLIDGAFRIFMWMLLDPVGRRTFYFLDGLALASLSAYLIWDIRRSYAVEKTRRPSDTRAQWKGSEGEDEGTPR